MLCSQVMFQHKEFENTWLRLTWKLAKGWEWRALGLLGWTRQRRVLGDPTTAFLFFLLEEGCMWPQARVESLCRAGRTVFRLFEATLQ